jgi:AraC-like DNA-binding protein
MSTSRKNVGLLSLEIGVAEAEEMPRAQDYWNVNLHEPWEVAFWAREFGCSAEELRHAVGRVGSRAGDVRAQLANR